MPGLAKGQLWWARNDAVGISDPRTHEHPVLVVRGSNIQNGPVQVITGTTAHGNHLAEPTFVIRPEQLDADGATGYLGRPTTFLITREFPVTRDDVFRYMGCIPSDVLEQILEIRRQSRR